MAFRREALYRQTLKPNEKKQITFTEGTPSQNESKGLRALCSGKDMTILHGKTIKLLSVCMVNLWRKSQSECMGMDAWSKRTNRLILDEWYKLNNYHKDNGDGLDFFHVGSSLGQEIYYHLSGINLPI